MSALRSLVRKSQMAMLPQDARSVLRDRLTYLSPAKISRLTRAVGDVVDRQVPGDILEFGVAPGGSSVLLARHASPERQFHGFDVFGLIPPPSSAKDDAKSKERYQVISSGHSIGIGGMDITAIATISMRAFPERSPDMDDRSMVAACFCTRGCLRKPGQDTRGRRSPSLISIATGTTPWSSA